MRAACPSNIEVRWHLDSILYALISNLAKESLDSISGHHKNLSHIVVRMDKHKRKRGRTRKLSAQQVNGQGIAKKRSKLDRTNKSAGCCTLENKDVKCDCKYINRQDG